MKKVLSLILATLLSVGVIGLAACKKTIAVVDSIAIKNVPTVTSKIGEDFAIADDGKITVSYSDKTTKEVAITLSMIDVNAINVNSAEEQDVKVSYEGKSTTFKVTLTVNSNEGEGGEGGNGGEQNPGEGGNGNGGDQNPGEGGNGNGGDQNPGEGEGGNGGSEENPDEGDDGEDQKTVSSIDVFYAPSVTSVYVGKDVTFGTNGKLLVEYSDETKEYIAITSAMIDVDSININSTEEQTVKVSYEGKETEFTIKLLNPVSQSGSNWIPFSPSTHVSAGTTATRTTNERGIKVTNYVISAGTTSVNLEHEDKSAYNAGKYQVRIPTVRNNPTYVELHVTNNGSNHVDFTFGRHSDANNSTNISLDGEESGTFTLAISTADVIGDWYQIAFDSATEQQCDITIYGYIYVGNFEIDELTVENTSDIKLSYSEGESFDISNLILSAKIKNSKGEFLADGTAVEKYYIASGYTVTGLTQGQTLSTAGTYPITVSIDGKSVSLDVVVASHQHNIVAVPKKDATCTVDGYEAHYKCDVDGCNQLFADAEGNSPIASPTIITAGHVCIPVAVGGNPYCLRCNEEVSGMNSANWVYWNLTTQTGSSISGGSITADTVNSQSGTKVHIPAGTTAGSKFQLCMNNNDSGKQTVIPNLSANATAGQKRHIKVCYVNYGNEDITIRLQNDNNGGEGSVIVPANGYAICEFDVTNVAGSNWFYLNVDSNVSSDVDLGVYGCFYINDGELSELSINTQATKLSFTEGETFSSNGLVLDALLPSTTPKTVYVQSGYTTDLDGHTFTAEDVGTKTVTVTFAGKTVTYDITVTAA